MLLQDVPEIPLWDIHPSEMKPYGHKNLLYGYSYGIICNSQKVEITQMFISWWIDKYNMVYPHNRISLGNKNNEILYILQYKWNFKIFY